MYIEINLRCSSCFRGGPTTTKCYNTKTTVQGHKTDHKPNVIVTAFKVTVTASHPKKTNDSSLRLPIFCATSKLFIQPFSFLTMLFKSLSKLRSALSFQGSTAAWGSKTHQTPICSTHFGQSANAHIYESVGLGGGVVCRSQTAFRLPLCWRYTLNYDKNLTPLQRLKSPPPHTHTHSSASLGMYLGFMPQSWLAKLIIALRSGPQVSEYQVFSIWFALQPEPQLQINPKTVKILCDKFELFYKCPL